MIKATRMPRNPCKLSAQLVANGPRQGNVHGTMTMTPNLNYDAGVHDSPRVQSTTLPLETQYRSVPAGVVSPPLPIQSHPTLPARTPK